MPRWQPRATPHLMSLSWRRLPLPSKRATRRCGNVTVADAIRDAAVARDLVKAIRVVAKCIWRLAASRPSLVAQPPARRRLLPLFPRALAERLQQPHPPVARVREVSLVQVRWRYCRWKWDVDLGWGLLLEQVVSAAWGGILMAGSCQGRRFQGPPGWAHTCRR